MTARDLRRVQKPCRPIPAIRCATTMGCHRRSGGVGDPLPGRKLLVYDDGALTDGESLHGLPLACVAVANAVVRLLRVDQSLLGEGWGGSGAC
jgi:hypothetical protein